MQERNKGHRYLLAMPAGINQKRSVNIIVSKVSTRFSLSIVYKKEKPNFTFFQFISENFTVILFHYDGNVDDWHGLKWSKNVIHISAINQTKW